MVLPFVYEVCVRVNVGRELLDFSKPDCLLLGLERMRMTDMYNCWSRNTLTSYKAVLKTLNYFQLEFGLPVLHPTFPAEHFTRPSTDASVTFT